MLVLAFDTATAAVTVALCEWTPGEGAHIRAVMPKTRRVGAMAEPDRRRHAELLAPGIAAVLAESQVTRTDLSAVAVGVGPGPYTGLRVGLATAQALGAALEIPVHGVCTLDILASASGRTAPFIVATDARRKEIYWARYDSAGARAQGPAVGKPADAAAYGLPVIGEGSALYPEVFDGPNEPLRPSAAALAELTVARLSGRPGLSLVPPEPLYLRRPDAREPGPRKRVTRR